MTSKSLTSALAVLINTEKSRLDIQFNILNNLNYPNTQFWASNAKNVGFVHQGRTRSSNDTIRDFIPANVLQALSKCFC